MMYPFLISLCIAALFCNTLTQAADNFGVLDASEHYAAYLPVSEEIDPVPSSFALAAEVPDTAIYHSEDLEDSLSEPPLESNHGTSPQLTESEPNIAPNLGSNEATEDEDSDPTHVSSSSVVVSTTIIYQALPSDSQPTAIHVEIPNTMVMPTANDSEVRGKFGTDDELPGSTPGNTTSTLATETSSISSTMSTMTYNMTTFVQPSMSSVLSSTSQVETSTALSNSSYVSSTTLFSSASGTAPISEITTSLFNSSTSQTFTPSTASSSEATSEVPSSTYTSSSQYNNPTNTTSSTYTKAASTSVLPSAPGNISSSETISEFPSSTLSSSLEYYIPTNTSSNIYSEPTSIGSLSSVMSIPSVTPSSSSGSLNYTIPSTTSSDTSSPSSTDPSTLPGNSSATAFPETSSASPTESSSLPGNSSATAFPDTSSASPTESSSLPGNSSATAFPDTSSASPTESSSLPGNSSATAFPDTSTNTLFSPTNSVIYPSSTLMPVPGNSTTSLSPGSSPTTIPHQSATQLPNSTYTSLPSNSSMIGSSSQTETLSITSSYSKVMPTATNTESTFIPSSIIAQTSSSYTSGQTISSSTGIPSSLPKIVQNPMSSSSPSQPEDTAEIQIGFQWELNYPFVVGHPLSTSQIFTYLPIGIADGLGLNSEQIVVKNLFPLDTTEELNYITTVARVFIPASMVDTLRIDLGISASPIYQNDDDSVRTLMNFINPAIPYFPGTVMQHGAFSSVSASHSTSTPSPNSGVFNTETQQPQTASAKGTTAGIALAACGGAAAYGAAMFLLARRYKHRQQQQDQPNRPRSLETTSSSIESAESNAEYGNDGAQMSGGRISNSHDRHSRGSGRTGYSARTAQISGPMMSENSLGWT